MGTRFVAILIAASFCACSNDRATAVATPTTPTATADEFPRPVPPDPLPPGRVQGVVLDFQTAQPIAGAVVGFATDYSTGPIGMTETAVSDANGRYSLTQPPRLLRNGLEVSYVFVVNNQGVGRGYPRAVNYRGDLAVDRGKCVARYGMVLDSKTSAPIVGATARDLSDRLRATTDKDGWYHIDWGCGVGQVGFNTTWYIMSHPNYRSGNFASGRGVVGNYREDVKLDSIISKVTK